MKKLIIVFTIIAIVGGLGYMITQSQHHFDHHSVLDKIHHEESANQNAHQMEDNTMEFEKNEMDTSDFLKVHTQDPNLKSFFTQFRSKDILSFPCQNCHNTPLSNMQSNAELGKKAHWDVKMSHADASIMNCTTCHHPENMNYLKSLSGEMIHIDNSFEMCGQCHTTQYKDWQGGAHGKSVSGWKPPRIVKTCVNCHNPHNPTIETRWPSRLVKQDNPD